MYLTNEDDLLEYYPDICINFCEVIIDFELFLRARNQVIKLVQFLAIPYIYLSTLVYICIKGGTSIFVDWLLRPKLDGDLGLKNLVI